MSLSVISTFSSHLQISQKVFFLDVFWINLECTAHITKTSYISHRPHSPWFYYPRNIKWRPVSDLFVRSSVCCYSHTMSQQLKALNDLETPKILLHVCGKFLKTMYRVGGQPSYSVVPRHTARTRRSTEVRWFLGQFLYSRIIYVIGNGVDFTAKKIEVWFTE